MSAIAKWEPLVLRAVKRYRSSCPGLEDDLMQEGRIAVLLATGTFDASAGTPIEAYLWRAVMLRLRRYLWATLCPVSGTRHRPSETAKGLRGASLVTLQEREENGDTPPDDTRWRAPEPEAALIEARWHARVRDRLTELVGGDNDALGALLGETEGASPETRKRAVKARSRLMRDRPSLSLLRERDN